MEGQKKIHDPPKLKYTPPKLKKWGTVASQTMATGAGVFMDAKRASSTTQGG
jgi:hypothetical protein